MSVREGRAGDGGQPSPETPESPWKLVGRLCTHDPISGHSTHFCTTFLVVTRCCTLRSSSVSVHSLHQKHHCEAPTLSFGAAPVPTLRPWVWPWQMLDKSAWVYHRSGISDSLDSLNSLFRVAGSEHIEASATESLSGRDESEACKALFYS